MLRLSRAFWCVLLLPFGSPAQSVVHGAQEASAAVAPACLVQSADQLSLGAYSPLSGLASTASGSVRLRCTKGASVTVVPTQGGNSLQGPGGGVRYGLYTNASFSQVWGAPQTQAVSLNTGNNTLQGISYWQAGVTAAQFQAHSDWANQLYFYRNGTYYVGYFGQGSAGQARASAVGVSPAQIGFSVNDQGTLKVPPVIAHGSDPTQLPGGANAPAGYIVLPANAADYTGSGGNYTVQVPLGATAVLTGTATGVHDPLVLTYYGQAPAGQDVTPGSYQDTVVFTVSF